MLFISMFLKLLRIVLLQFDISQRQVYMFKKKSFTYDYMYVHYSVNYIKHCLIVFLTEKVNKRALS